MGFKNIDGILLRKAIISASNELAKNKDIIDSLNVFPVPDGDTGTNMSLTLLFAAREVEKLNTPNVYDVAKVASDGCLRGARGNSGVILSQLFRGFAKTLENKAIINADDIAKAFMKASEMAYKAVMKPKEGTILTIAKAIADKALEYSLYNEDIEKMMKEALEHAKKVLDSTTEMLPELKQAGVVDSGGKGLLVILEGVINSFNLEDVKVESFSTENKKRYVSVSASENIQYGYCTEFFINVQKASHRLENTIKMFLDTVGDSIVVVCDDKIVKIHVHTEHPGTVLEYALKLGSLSNIKIENMREQHTNMISFVEKTNNDDNNETSNIQLNEDKTNTKKEVGFIAVLSGDGFCEIFKELGVDEIIQGGQSMNPNIDEIMAAISAINSENIVILPNNKNIILSAKQAAELSKDKKVYVIPTKTIPQGISAMVNYVPDYSFEENIKSMQEAIYSVKTGQVTYAARDTKIDDREIKEGNIICILDDNIQAVDSNIFEGAKNLVDEMLKEDKDLISIYYGEDISEEDASQLYTYVEENYPKMEIEFKNGGQPLYYYIISVE